MSVVQEWDGFVEEYALREVTPPKEEGPRGEDEATRKLREERRAVAHRLGLPSLVQRRPRVYDPAAAILFYPEWKGSQLKDWHAFLPKRYSYWESYHFDVIPLRALKAMEAAKFADVFGHIEIWTPEGRRTRRERLVEVRRRAAAYTDPVAVGVITDGRKQRFFPIVRWGEEELVSDWAVRWSRLCGNR